MFNNLYKFQNKHHQFYSILKLLFTITLFAIYSDCLAQDTIPATDTLLLNRLDSITQFNNITVTDTFITEIDTIAPAVKKPKKSPIESEVLYNSRDSFKISLAEQKVYLYGEAQVNYQNIELKADYIVFDMTNNVEWLQV